MEVSKKEIRRLFFFKYEFREAKSLVEIKDRLNKTFQFIPPESLLKVLDQSELSDKPSIAMKSLSSKIPMIYFLLVQEDEKGGKVVVFETTHSWYSYEKVISSMRAYCRNAGIRCKLLYVRGVKKF